MVEQDNKAAEIPQTQRTIPTAVWAAVGIFALLSTLAAAMSQGFLEADACTHYLSATFGFRQPLRLVSVWDRPLFMLLYTPAAAFGGVLGARALSLALAILCGWCAWQIARRLGIRRPELALLFTLGQPLLFLHSFAELTELCFAAVIGLAFLAFMDRRWGWMAALVAISPLGRPEGFGFMALATLVLLCHRQWKWLLVLPLGLILWTWVGWQLWHRPDYGLGPANFLAWLPRQWPYSGTSTYDAGPLFLWRQRPDGTYASSFLLRLPMLIGPLLFPFMLAGTWIMLRGWQGRIRTHAGRTWLAVVFLPWSILLGHSFLWWRGLMASNGELRYLLVTAPLWGVIGAAGFSALALEALAARKCLRPALAVGILALLPALANVFYRVVPLPLYDDDRLSRQVAEWYSGNAEIRAKYPRLTASYVAVYLYLHFSPTDWSRTVLWGKELIRERPKDVVLIWDAINATHNADANMCITEQELTDNGWTEIQQFREGNSLWRAFVAADHATTTPAVGLRAGLRSPGPRG